LFIFGAVVAVALVIGAMIFAIRSRVAAPAAILDVAASPSPTVEPSPSPSASPSTSPSPKEEKKQKSENANKKKDSRLGSILNKAGRILKKPFKH
jgi:hypothetical protein